MITNKLVNPTPFEVDWKWHAGIHIKIAPDDSVQLSNDQMRDFTPGQPGSEAVQSLMNEYGIFLRDNDRSYEAQALEAIRACIRVKSAQYNDSTNRLRSARAAQGIMDNPEALEETFRQLGLTNLRERIERLKHREKMFAKVVEEQGAQTATEKMDPDRTLIFVDPPKVFETKFALQVFLSEPQNAEIRKKYESWRRALDKKSAPATAEE